MLDPSNTLEINRRGWDAVARLFRGRDALPCYGPLAPTEDELRLLDGASVARVLELGCGSGHSLEYLARRGAEELWGLDLSPVQIAAAAETLRAVRHKTRLIESPMEIDAGLPSGYFDLVFSVYGIGWSTNLPATLAFVSRYLRPGGVFIASGEHPAYSCIEWNGSEYVFSKPYSAEGAQEHSSWNGSPIVIQRRTLGTFVTQIARAGLVIEALIEPHVNAASADPQQADPSRWYSVPRATLVPTTFILKARKPE